MSEIIFSYIPSPRVIQDLSRRLGWAGGIPLENAKSIIDLLSQDLNQDVKFLIEAECVKIKSQWRMGDK